MLRLFRIVLVTLCFASLSVVILTALTPSSARAQAPEELGATFEKLSAEYESQVHSLVSRYCNDCHSTADMAGELDLEVFASLQSIRNNPQPWLRVREMLHNGEMPPKDADQLTSDEKSALVDWVSRYLDAEALAQAGDPGPVVLRRLSNAEYTYTIQDLVGIPLEPAREFPIDGAAGEGFANTGAALVMSPSLVTKYVDAAKEVASHLVLLPSGIEFSPGTSRRDFANERLATLHRLYNTYADEQGKIPFERYLTALALAHRSTLAQPNLGPEAAIVQTATQQGLSPQFLFHLHEQLESTDPNPLLQGARDQWTSWKQDADQPFEGMVGGIAGHFRSWQNALVRFQNVGHLKPWQVDVDPLVEQASLRTPLNVEGDGSSVRFEFFSANPANDDEYVLWENPIIVGAGRPAIPLSQVPTIVARRTALRDALIDATPNALAAVAELEQSNDSSQLPAIASRHDIAPELLAAWASLFGLQSTQKPKLDLLAQTIDGSSGYAFVQGFGSGDTPLILASSSDMFVRIPGKMKPHGVVVHPSPSLKIAVGWQAPVSGQFDLQSVVTHAHGECGNGVVWSVELRRGSVRRLLAEGIAHGDAPQSWASAEPVSILEGDLVSLIVAPRDGNHSCDLTDLEFTITEREGEKRQWNLTQELSPNILAGNPHADRFGNDGIWSFYTEPVDASARASSIPVGCTLDQWWNERDATRRTELASQIQSLLRSADAAGLSEPDAQLSRSLRSFSANWFSIAEQAASELGRELPTGDIAASQIWGVPTELFLQSDPTQGNSNNIAMSLSQGANLEFRLPRDLVEGCELVVNVKLLEPQSATVGQPRITSPAAPPLTQLTPGLSLLSSGSRNEWLARFEAFRYDFPAGLCYTQIVPIDEVVTLALYHREDEALSRWFLNEAEQQELERAWLELHFVSRDAVTMVDAFQQLMEYATQDSDPGLFEPFREPIRQRAEEFEAWEKECEEVQLSGVLEIAAKAFRRDLHESDEEKLRILYSQLRTEGLNHEDSLKMLLVRVLVSPQFLFKLEAPAEGTESSAVSSWELATRLSYFLWSSAPDERLRAAAADGSLLEDEKLLEITRAMLSDAKMRRTAIEFGTRYLHVYDFANHDEKSEQFFPEFPVIRDELYEETIQLFTHAFQENGSVLDLFAGDHTYLNQTLAEFYGIPGVTGEEWRRVDGVRQYGRGGFLGLGSTLAKQSGASRTSPILRGNWVSEVLLGEKLPKPPAGVPPIPDDGTLDPSLTMRQIVELHSSDPKCVECHRRIDPLGFALEGFDAIGRTRVGEEAENLDLSTTLLDGTDVIGLEGLRDYLSQQRLYDLERVFCRKLLGYALGRSVQLSDEPLIDRMLARLQQDDHRIHGLIEEIVLSPQFRRVRGRDVAIDQHTN